MRKFHLVGGVAKIRIEAAMKLFPKFCFVPTYLVKVAGCFYGTLLSEDSKPSEKRVIESCNSSSKTSATSSMVGSTFGVS